MFLKESLVVHIFFWIDVIMDALEYLSCGLFIIIVLSYFAFVVYDGGLATFVPIVGIWIYTTWKRTQM